MSVGRLWLRSMLAYSDVTGEALGGRLGIRNAGAVTASD
jgi:hypothetical protein